MMRLYVENGRRAKALQQYQVCCQALESELAVTPAAETEALYRRLLTGSDGGHGQEAAALNENSANEPTLQEATAQLQAAVQTMQAAQKSLEQAMALVARLKSGEIRDWGLG
ncbi:MAG: hypothetical protein D6698_03470 [Gammaproteobacteria bacterium]|nr:MAG: hypothetical protein D6698_03470 [Gammaproteobacteria bacterium]